MAELKTKPTKASVAAFLREMDDPRKREDARAVMALMKDVTGKRPKMWGTSIVGFGSYRYLKKLDDVDRKVLGRLVARSVTDMKKLYACT